MSGGQDSSAEAQEVVVVPATPATPRTGMMLGGAIAVLVVAVVGAFFAASAQDEPSEVDVAAPAAEVVEDDTQETDETEGGDESGPVEEDAVDGDDTVDSSSDEVMNEAGTDVVESAADAMIGIGGGVGNVFHTSDGFVSIGWGPDGLAVSRSADGTEWASAPIVGLPADSNLVGLAEYSGGHVAVVEVWDESDIESEGPMFGPPPPPVRLVATSSDLETWETSPLPDVAVEDGGFSHVSGMAVSGDTIAMQLHIEPPYVDEVQVLFDAGILTEDTLQNYCGARFDGPDEVIVVMTCDFEAQDELYFEFEQKMEAAESDEERAAIEEEFFGGEVEPGSEELVRLEPGDPVHTALSEAYTIEPEMARAVVLSGPIGGPYTETELPADGYTSQIGATDAGFMTVVHDWEAESITTLRSVDGVTWTEGTPIAGGRMDVQGIVATGDLMVAVGNRWEEPNGSLVVLTTSDLGTTWNEVELGTELFGAWGMPQAGPAGVAIMIDGSAEPYPEFPDFEEPASIVVTSEDGYQLEVLLMEESLVFSGPDGAVIHEVVGISEQDPEDDGIDGVFTVSGEFNSTVTFLDPDTGDALATFTDADFEAAYSDLPGVGPGAEFEEPPRRTELWFSADGVAWELLESDDTSWDSNSWTSLAGVGDDEVLVRSETWVEPPAELLAFEEDGSEPTEEDLAALEAWEAENYSNNVEWRRIPVG